MGDLDASLPERGGILGPDGLPIKASLDGKPMPKNDEGLVAVEILGRCSRCKITGWIDYPGKHIPAKDIDTLLNYRPVKCFCAGCKSMSEFLPIEYKKYRDLPMLENIQKGFTNGKVR
jgi:hypothetical protein